MRTYPDKQTMLPIALASERDDLQNRLGEHDIRREYDTVRADHDDRSALDDLVFWGQTPKDLRAPHLYIR